MAYAYPRLSGFDCYFFRLLGVGLGNLLFPWARAAVASRDHGFIRIQPTWPQFKPRTFLRAQSDPRLYAGLFKADHDEVAGVARLRALVCGPRVDERAPVEAVRGGTVVTFTGVGDLFGSFLTEHEFVASKLMRIVRPEHLRTLDQSLARSVAVHVRLGDFTTRTEPPFPTPIEWYARSIHKVREVVGSDAPFLLFSDDSDEALRSITSIPGVRRAGFGSAISDLIAMSRTAALIGAAGSTFGMWASYLGRMPALWTSGPEMPAWQQNPYYDDPERELRLGVRDALSPAFADRLTARARAVA